MSYSRQQRPAIAAMSAGLALTVVAMIVPWVDRATGHGLADHIKAGYPAYTAGRIDTAVMTWLTYLTILGAVGIACWLYVIKAVRSGKRLARILATAGLVLGLGIALFNLLVRDTSGDTGLTAMLGWVGMLPSLAGLLAVTLLWRRSPAAPRA